MCIQHWYAYVVTGSDDQEIDETTAQENFEDKLKSCIEGTSQKRCSNSGQLTTCVWSCNVVVVYHIEGKNSRQCYCYFATPPALTAQLPERHPVCWLSMRETECECVCIWDEPIVDCEVCPSSKVR